MNENYHDERFRGRDLIVSMSGGKDSDAMALHLEELGLEFIPVFLDTGWEHPATVEYVNTVLEERFGPITTLRSERGGMVEWINKKMMFPGRTRRFCTEQLKSIPIRDFLATLDDPINAVGIRAEESRKRSTMPEWEESEWMDATVWRPIIDWTEEQVIAMHTKHGLPPNPLYLQGASRVGCFPCIYARKAEVKMVGDLWPARIDEIAAIEEQLTELARSKVRARAETPWPEEYPVFDLKVRRLAERTWKELAEDRPLRKKVRAVTSQSWPPATKLDRLSRIEGVPDLDAQLAILSAREAQMRDPEDQTHQRTFFGPGEQGRGWSNYDIHSILEWSRTGRGGRQFALFDARPTDEGCMRWGLCEHPAASRALVQVDE